MERLVIYGSIRGGGGGDIEVNPSEADDTTKETELDIPHPYRGFRAFQDLFKIYTSRRGTETA